MRALTLLLVDMTAIIGFVAALLGAAAGALGTYFATVGAARQQSRARVRAALDAIRAQVNEHAEDAPGAAERLKRQHLQLSRLVKALRAMQAGRSYELAGRTLDPSSKEDLAALLDGNIDLGVSGLTAAAWTTVLAPDAAFVAPELYSALVGYEGVLKAITELNAQTVPVLFDFYHRFGEAEPLTLHQLSEVNLGSGGELLALARRLDMYFQALADLFHQLQTQLALLQSLVR